MYHKLIKSCLSLDKLFTILYYNTLIILTYTLPCGVIDRCILIQFYRAYSFDTIRSCSCYYNFSKICFLHIEYNFL